MIDEKSLTAEVEDLRARLGEAEEMVRAIRRGEVDALVVEGAQGDQVFTLKGADHSYRIFLEEMHEGAATLTAQGVILYCNRRFAAIVGTPLEDVIGGSIYRFVREGERTDLGTVLAAGLKGAGKGELTFRNGTAAAGSVPVYLAASALPLEEDVEAVCLVVTDLTEQKRNQELVAAEKLASSIFEHATEAIVVCDTEERVLRASLAARRLCACNPVGRIFSDSFPLISDAPGDGPAIPFAEVFAGHVVQGIEASLTLESGEVCRFQASAGPLLAPDGVLGCVLTLTDITARRRAELEVDRARREAEAANQAKDHFLATLSHELRTPLTPVLAVISGLQEDARLPEDVLMHLAMVRRNVELEARLIDDMLDLTRVARGKLELHRETADLRQVIDHALQTASGDLLAKRLRLVLDLGAGDHALQADTPRLIQVFWNLFSNAVKFTPQGGAITVRSWCEETAAGPHLAVEVADTGIGIEPDVLVDIFEAFQQGEQAITRRYGGLGLGLAISKAIVELHGGRLDARSEGAGQGSVFSVRLPVGDVRSRPAAPDAAGAASDRSEAPATVPAELHILLVEDHADTAAAMAELLREMGHRVTVAHSVAAGLAAAERTGGGIDLVLSDLGLPDGTGLDLMAELHGRYGVKGIALSGYGMEEDVRRSLEAGFERHLTKPVNLQALQSAIQETARG
jgi:PAS domain S-box-containing protein